MQLDLIYQLAHRMLMQAEYTDNATARTVALHPLMQPGPYRRDNLAQVVEAKCTGCTFCSLDCPFEAITMQERAPGSKFKLIAVVQEARCSECGVCVGACPFQAIELPNTHSKTIEAEVLDLLKQGA